MRNLYNFLTLNVALLIVQITNSNAQYLNYQNNKGRLLTEEEGCGVPRIQNGNQLFIIGGSDTADGAFPWMALLGYENNWGEHAWRCGGSLITSQHVLTAAHCINRALKLVRLGEYDISKRHDGGVQDIQIIRTERHPNFNKREGTSDIAIVYLERDAKFTAYVWPICLPIGDRFRTTSFSGLSSTIAGWGRLKEGGKTSDVLQQLDVPILDNFECKERFRNQRRLVSENQFSELVICAGDLNGGHDSCQGDSGGPMMHATQLNNQKQRYYQIGIISYGIGCARVDTPGVYTRVSEFIDWIQDSVQPEADPYYYDG